MNSRVPQGVPKIADLTVRVDIDVEQRTAASEDKGCLRSFLLMGLQKFAQGEVREHVPIVAEDGFVFIQKILNIFQPARRVQKHRFMAEGDGYAPPAPIRKFFRVDVRAVMGIHDKAIHANPQEMIHHVGDDGTPSDLQERLGTSICQGPKPRAQSAPRINAVLNRRFFNVTSLE